MARRFRKVVWTDTGQNTLDEAVAYVAQDSMPPALRLLETALDAAGSLAVHSERGRIVPELMKPNIRELLILKKYRLIYEVFEAG